MKSTLEQDWERVVDIWVRVRDAFWDPKLVASESIYEMRKLDRGIDYPLRRLLNSEKYGGRIRTYGAPSSMFGRHPFKWDNKVWYSIRVKIDYGFDKLPASLLTPK